MSAVPTLTQALNAQQVQLFVPKWQPKPTFLNFEVPSSNQQPITYQTLVHTPHNYSLNPTYNVGSNFSSNHNPNFSLKPATLSLTNIPRVCVMQQPQCYYESVGQKRSGIVYQSSQLNQNTQINQPFGQQLLVQPTFRQMPQLHQTQPQQHIQISKLPHPSNNPKFAPPYLPMLAPIPYKVSQVTKVQQQAHQTIFQVPKTLIDYIVYTFKTKIDPPREMQYKSVNTLTSSYGYIGQQIQYPDLHVFAMKFLSDNRIPVMVLVYALVYLDRFSKRLTKRSYPAAFAPHLIFLAAVLVAAKFCDDLCILTSRDVSVQFRGLFSIQDVSRIERSFMSIIKYKLNVSIKDIEPILLKHNIDKDQLLNATHISPP